MKHQHSQTRGNDHAKATAKLDFMRIRRRARELHLKRGTQPGNIRQAWLQAEREVNEWRETQKFG